MSDPLRGTARYTADLPAGDALHVAFLRADRAHAEIRGLDPSEARAAEGVHAVLTAEDLAPLGDFPAFLRQSTVDGRPLAVPRRPVLAEGRVRHVGELVAMVVARSAAAARLAAETILPDYHDLPAIVGLDAAAAGPEIHECAPGNRAATVAQGDEDAVAAALSDAAEVVETTVELPRMAPAPMEPLAAHAAYDPGQDTFDLWTPHQGIAEQRRDLCATLGVPPERVRVHAERVGGAFGVRGAAFPETVALLAAARRLGRRLRWQGSRGEGLQTEYHGRGMRLRGRLALDAAHRFTGLAVEVEADLGAYVHPVGAHIAVSNPLAALTGCYRIPAASARFTLHFTNAVPVGPFRGAGRPEIALLVERLVDEAAARTGLDPLELRRRNALLPEAFPYATPVGARYDSGDYPGLIERARDAADWAGFAARAEADRARGALRGIGTALFVEVAGGGAAKRDTVRLDVSEREGSARIAIATATMSTGQDHEAMFRGYLAARLGLPEDRLSLDQSPATDTPEGAGSFGSRSTIQAGAALHRAGIALVERLIAQEAAARGLAADTLVADAQAIRGPDGAVLCTLAAALDRAAREGPFAVSGASEIVQTFPSGCHVAEVRLDPETGEMRVVRYSAVDDAGRVLSPSGVEGQIRGGVAQGISGALMERHVLDGHGQLLTASLMDYALPRADDIPPIGVVTLDVPSPTNPLGAKGVGEAGTTGALVAVTNAAADALRRAGAALPPFPLTSQAL